MLFLQPQKWGGGGGRQTPREGMVWEGGAGGGTTYEVHTWGVRMGGGGPSLPCLSQQD